MKSLAIWHQESDSEEKNEIDLHINFWKLPVKKNEFNRFLDIGIKIYDTKKIKKIFLYVPFIIQKDNIHDLGEIIVKNHDGLLNAIFNESYKIKGGDTSNYHEITDESGAEITNIYSFEKDDILLESMYSGTKVTIELPKNVVKQKTYIRFRIQTKELDRFSIEQSPISIFNSAFTKMEIFDFRINSFRHLPNRLIEQITERSKFLINTRHFFYICSYKENYILSHKPFNNTRQLELNIWKPYIKIGQNNFKHSEDETFIAYHWKQTDILIKTEFEHNNWATIFKYTAYLSLFTVVISLLSNYIFLFLKDNFL